MAGKTSFIDLTGKTFTDWKVKKYLGNGYWECQCSCGTVRRVLGKTLRNGTSTSCGHDINLFDDLTDKHINDWTVIKYAGDGNWLCRCSCGKESIVGGYDLRHNKSTNCGHARYEALSERNKEQRVRLEGTKINDWEVLRYLGNKHYECRCSCGRIKSVASYDLTAGISKSCGHNNGQSRIKDLTGMRFGELEVKEYIGNKKWRCQCSCGNMTEVTTGNLKNMSVRSCGCKQYNKISKEEFIEAINNYTFKYGEKPFISDLSVMLDRHEGNINRYINEYDLRMLLNCEYGSRAERELFSMFGNGILHDRQVLKGRELDIYYPDKNLAIEFNGNYWHSTIYKDKMYHQQKTIDCAKQGIQLIHVFEYEWNNSEKKAKIASIINRKLNSNNNVRIVYGRNTDVRVIDTESTKYFLNKYHLQNYTGSSINIGCYYNTELIGVMTFGKPRFNSNYQYELIRLAWKSNIAVVGGVEKLFKHFLVNYQPKSIVTYCDISKFTGNTYEKLGFTTSESCLTKPNYVWVNTLDNIVLTRYKTMKSSLLEEGLGNADQTEEDIMSNMGYFQVYDCGNLRLTWHN